MDFFLTEEQKMFQAMVRDFANNVVKPRATQMDEDGKFPWDIFKQAAELGIFGITIDEKYGGCGGDYLTMTLCGEELSRACAGLGTIYLANLSLAFYPINKFGTEEQKQKYAPPVARGEKICCFVLTEPGAGSDAGAITTTATATGDGIILNGNKIFITNGAEAEIAVVFATEDKSKGNKGISAFIVEKGTPGFSVGKIEEKMGLHGDITAELIFDNARVPKENLLGKAGEGFKVAMALLDGGRVGIGAQGLGIAQAALDAAIEYSKIRVQFGKPISSFQGVQFMLADMATRVDAARMLVYRAARMRDMGLPYSKEASMAKMYATDTAMQVATDAVQIFGGYGYSKEYPVERYMRDAKITQIYEGTNQIQRMVIAKHLVK